MLVYVCLGYVGEHEGVGEWEGEITTTTRKATMMTPCGGPVCRGGRDCRASGAPYRVRASLSAAKKAAS